MLHEADCSFTLMLHGAGREGVVRAGLVALVAAALLGGCRLSGMAFTQDDRVNITNPRSRSHVTLPLTLEWQATPDLVADAGRADGTSARRFGVMVDRDPPAPGRSLASLAADDEVCRETPRCPDAEWFAKNGMYVTSEERLQIPFLPDLRKLGQLDSRDAHEVTIILLNSELERVGESAWWVRFYVDRRDETPP